MLRPTPHQLRGSTHRSFQSLSPNPLCLSHSRAVTITQSDSRGALLCSPRSSAHVYFPSAAYPSSLRNSRSRLWQWIDSRHTHSCLHGKEKSLFSFTLGFRHLRFHVFIHILLPHQTQTLRLPGKPSIPPCPYLIWLAFTLFTGHPLLTLH